VKVVLFELRETRDAVEGETERGGLRRKKSAEKKKKRFFLSLRLFAGNTELSLRSFAPFFGSAFTSASFPLVCSDPAKNVNSQIRRNFCD
jgi:hypothetical protein